MYSDVYSKLAHPENKMFVAIAGNIGCGKSTLTRKLADRLGWRPQFESVEDNPYLGDFYKDMERYSFPLQVYFLTHRFNTHRMIETSNFSCIQDRTIYEDAHIFARGLHERGMMSTRDYQNYLTLYKTMVAYLNAPTLMIYLKRSVPRLMERIKKRGRECEKDMATDYIAELNVYYEDWFATYKDGKALVVDTDDLDFIDRETDFERLVAKIHESIEQQDLFFTYH